MQTVAEYLTAAHEGLRAFEEALRKAVPNQNISDVIASARGKILQAAQHPDAATELHTLHDLGDAPGDGEPLK